MNTNHGYKIHEVYHCIDAYTYPDNLDDWLPCPRCNLKPKVWEFNNGKSTACGCWNSKYDHFSVCSESIMSYYARVGNLCKYNSDALRLNWNEYCMTYINPCGHSDLMEEGKW